MRDRPLHTRAVWRARVVYQYKDFRGVKDGEEREVEAPLTLVFGKEAKERMEQLEVWSPR